MVSPERETTSRAENWQSVNITMSETSSATATTAAAALQAQSAAVSARRGASAAIAAFGIWGLFPLYLIGLTSVSALEITAHRVLWSCVFVLGWIAVRGELSVLRDAAQRRDVMLRLVLSAVLVSVNWLIFVWGVNHDRVVEVSLGYYINPLVNVLLGIFVLSERLNRVQWIAVALAAVGVVYLTVSTGQPPWIALGVATSFALYGLIRKTVQIEALPGLGVEMMLLMPFALGYLIWCEVNGVAALGHSGPRIDILLLLSGIITAVPLVLFSYGARRIQYSTIGIIQYIAPTLQLLCGLIFFGEPFERTRLVGFAIIWAALLIYASDGLLRMRRLKAAGLV